MFLRTKWWGGGVFCFCFYFCFFLVFQPQLSPPPPTHTSRSHPFMKLLQKPGRFCFVVLNPRVLSASRVEFGLLCFIIFLILPPPPFQSLHGNHLLVASNDYVSRMSLYHVQALDLVEVGERVSLFAFVVLKLFFLHMLSQQSLHSVLIFTPPLLHWSVAEATGLGFVCFVFFNPHVLSANSVDFGNFCFYLNIFQVYPPKKK